MTDLDKYREMINEIDKQMRNLFEKRMQVAKDIALYKKDKGLTVYDPDREKIVIEKNVSLLHDKDLERHYSLFLQRMMDISKDYQYDLIKSANIITIDSNKGNYDVIIQKEGINDLSSYFDLNRKVLVVIDEHIDKVIEEKIVSQCKKAFVYHITACEYDKTLKQAEYLWDILVENDFDRHDAILSIGGGVTGDLSGFVASVYMRGIDFYNVPTTLLSQVDASIGGKTAVNYLGYKNLLGSFYPPKKVLIDTSLLASLDKRQIVNGLAESLKMAILADKNLFEIFEKNQHFERIDEIVYKSLLIKRDVVQKDEKEAGLRKILNYGHTIGHGIEILDDGYYHGECVALGMLALCSDKLYDKLVKIYKNMNLPIKCEIDSERLLEAISHDKKSIGEEVEVIYCEDVCDYKILKVNKKDLKERLNRIKKG